MKEVILISTQLLNNKLYIIVLASSIVIFCIVIILTITNISPRLENGQLKFVDKTDLSVSNEYVHDEELSGETTDDTYNLDDSETDVDTNDAIEPSL